VTGIRQRVVAGAGDREVLSLTLEMAVGLDDPRDEIELTGEPALRMVIPGGIHGDVATAAVAVNAVERLLDAEPGLRTMADLPPVHP
jgi:4-hydroxy-tetrahydrodipicolinate reductase